MDWDDVRYFLAVCRAGSIRGAALQLGVNHSTVSRRINQFEAHLGVRLFDKLPSGYVITAAGEEITDTALRIEENANSLQRKIEGRDSTLTGKLRITLPEILATHLLMPDLNNFNRTYPGIKLELVISDTNFNLSKREADIAIRITNNDPPEHLIGRKLLTYAVCTYASPEYLSQYDVASNASTGHWIGWEDENDYPPWIKQSDFPNTPVRHQVNQMSAQLAAARMGLGMSSLPCFMGDLEPGLKRVPGSPVRPKRDIWLLTHHDLRKTSRIRAFTQFMADSIRAHADLLEGRHVETGDAP